MTGTDSYQIECTKRDIGHLCTKDERHPRAKRARMGSSHKESDAIVADETAQILEDFVEGSSRTNMLSSSGSTSSTPAPDYPNFYWETAESGMQNERFSLIEEITNAFPDSEMAHHLYGIFVTRCQGPLGNIFHTPTFLKHAGRIYESIHSASFDLHIVASSFSMESLACFLMALVLGLAFHPKPNNLGWSSTGMSERVEVLRSSSLYLSTWRTLALRCLRGRIGVFCASMASLQAALMLLLDGQNDSLELDSLLVAAISGAQKLHLHRLGDVKLDPLKTSPGDVDMPSHIRIELGTRIWWAFVLRDWCRGHVLGYYTIHPSQFNTRKPLHINDEDLRPEESENHGSITERPRSEFTMLSYTIYAIEIAGLVRESVDLRNPSSQAPQEKTEATKLMNELNKKYEKLLIALPSHFRPGSTVGLTSTGPLAAVPVQQWMLQQQLWSLFLRLYRGKMSSTSRATCQILAQNIISTSTQIQARCSVCGTLSINDIQLFNAAAALLINLLYTKSDNPDGLEGDLSRIMIKDKINEAIEIMKLRSDPGKSQTLTPRNIYVLESLMNFVEGVSSPEDRHGETEELIKDKKTHVIRLLSTYLEGNKSTYPEHDSDFASSTNTFMSLSNTPADIFGDLDVLPMLSDETDYDLWQFLDFTPDLQSPVVQ
ncbi:C6 transcription factor [Penicillium longicatenatum]|nr:C6 transcription factor [Penicillium longicatenatum]